MTLFPFFHRSAQLLAVALALHASLAAAQPAVAQTPRIAAAADVPYAGTIAIDVDLTDLDRRIMEVRETLPVKPGALTLLYPRWLPGKHSPFGAVTHLAGLQITANGKPVEWARDPVDVYAFHLQVPEGVRTLNIAFQHLSPVVPSTGRVVMARDIIGLQWNTVVLYPAGHYASAISMQASARLPSGWQAASALDVARRDGDRLVFKPTSLERLVDSPLWAGKHTKRIALDAAGKAPVYLTLFADAPSYLEAAPEQVTAHQQLVRQADALFGSRHFARYEFLLALSDHFSGIGLEHAESSENAVSPNFFTEWKKKDAGARSQLPHEYAHSWNGKFRIPADLWTPHFNQPMQGSLLWMYEGQTQYWGFVLAARSGMVSVAESLDSLAMAAASLDTRSGRAWRNLQDTTTDPVVSGRGPLDWSDWQRREEYYTEGQLIWLDADTKIRELTQGSKSLNDFAKAFFGVEDGRVTPLTYTMDDIVKSLNAVAPFDWASFLRQRLDTHANTTLLDGITRGGWKLVYTDKQSDAAKASEAMRRTADFYYSLGFGVDKDGKLTGVKWGGPAFQAGLTSAMQLVAVNSDSYKAELLREAIVKAKDGSGVELLVKMDDRYKTVKLDYRGGLRYPKLERIAGTPDRLTEILTAMP